MLIHSGEKPHRCSLCNKQFRYKGHLNRHLLIHNGEKPHKCDMCDKQFTQKSDLNGHLLTHTEENLISVNCVMQPLD